MEAENETGENHKTDKTDTDEKNEQVTVPKIDDKEQEKEQEQEVNEEDDVVLRKESAYNDDSSETPSLSESDATWCADESVASRSQSSELSENSLVPEGTDEDSIASDSEDVVNELSEDVPDEVAKDAANELGEDIVDEGTEEPEDVDEEVVMWKCAKCPLEFPDKASVIGHVKAVHKNPNQANKLTDDEASEAEPLTPEYQDYNPLDSPQSVQTSESKKPNRRPVTSKSNENGTRKAKVDHNKKVGRPKRLDPPVRKRRRNYSSDSNKKHYKSLKTPKIYVNCDICYFEVCDVNALKRHCEQNIYKPSIWKCTYCTELFVSQAESDEHLAAEHPAEKDDVVDNWNCEECPRSFSDKYELAHHQILHEVKQPWECACCQQRFETVRKLKQHEKIELSKYYGNTGFNCPDCDEVFLTNRQLLNHQRRAHLSPVQLQCEQCDKFFNSLQSLQKHKYDHVSDKPWDCKCGERFHEKAELINHSKEQHGEDDKSTCAKCGKIFRRAAALKQHELICLRPSDDEDEEEEEEEPVRKRHQSYFGSGSKRWERDCDVCGDIFTDQLKFRRHMKNHEDVARNSNASRRHPTSRPNVSFKCSRCAKVFAKREHLRIHSKCHAGERRLKCTQLDCPEQFLSPNARTQHLLISHGLTDQVFYCADCGEQFEKQRDLERHELTHLNPASPSNSYTEPVEGRFKCSTCGKSFMQEVVLKMHEKQHEPDQTEFDCQYCDKKFKNIASRNMHSKKAHPELLNTTSKEEITLD